MTTGRGGDAVGAVEVRAIPPDLARDLRHEVLRPHQAPRTILYPGEDAADALTVGAFLDGAIVGVATVHPDPDVVDAFRLRGMAVTASLRDRGIGSRLLVGCIEHCTAVGAARLWCNARTPAIRFYERHGFAVVSDEWAEPDIGPHVRMERPLR
ncbi:MAG: GNAT family N-acetyltransferase [Actinomycetota bacterium]